MTAVAPLPSVGRRSNEAGFIFLNQFINYEDPDACFGAFSSDHRRVSATSRGIYLEKPALSSTILRSEACFGEKYS
ncbi:MAG: hypothetical protein WAS21_08030 [Geminicoccaceae bacterium]